MLLHGGAQECRAVLTEHEDGANFLNFGFLQRIVRRIKNPKWVPAVFRHLIFERVVCLLSTSPSQIYSVENRIIIKLWIGYGLDLGGHDLIEVLSKNFSVVTEETYKIPPL